MSTSCGQRPLLALGVLLGCIILAAPATLRQGVRTLRHDAALSDREAMLALPPPLRKDVNLPLFLDARRRIPVHARYGLIADGRFTRGSASGRHARFVNATAWALAYLAPRVAVRDRPEVWTIVLDARPRSVAVLRPRAAWRFGRDWLVRR